MDSALEISTPIMAPVQISKKQTVVGNTYFKVFFLSLPISNLISNSIIVIAFGSQPSAVNARVQNKNAVS